LIYLLDTSAVLAHYFKEPGHSDVAQLIADPNAVLGISALTVYELNTRLRAIGIGNQDVVEVIETYTRTFDFVAPLTDDIASLGADLRASAGQRTSAVDVLIAATAVRTGGTLVHRDPHFASLPPGNPVQIVLPDKMQV